MLIRHLDTPEVCLEVVPKESLSFSTTPRSALRYAENGTGSNPSAARGPSFRFRKWDQPKTGRGPEGNRETP